MGGESVLERDVIGDNFGKTRAVELAEDTFLMCIIYRFSQT